MSNQFYNYLANKLINFFNENEEVRAGERFYVQLDEKSQVDEFYKVLSSEETSKTFTYKHEKGNAYETFCMCLKKVNVVVVSAKDVTDAYLVGVRNASQTQQGVWENKVLLILCDTPVDSITGGCKNLQKDGMPLSIKSISGNLSDEIESSEISKVDREIIKFYISQKLDDSYATSLWDYEEILSIINKKIIDETDYKKIGIFKDKALETFTPKVMQRRLKENHEIYAKVEGYQEYEDKVQQLEKMFDDRGINKLKDKNWAEADFKIIKDSIDSYKSQKALGYESNKKTVASTGDIVYWEKHKADTVAGRRKRFFVVFDNNKYDEFELTFNFDDTVKEEYLDSKAKKFVKASGKKLIAKIKSDSSKSSFYKIIYTHKEESKSRYDFNIIVVNTPEENLLPIKAIYEIDAKKKLIQINSDGTDVKLGNGISDTIVEIENENDTICISDGMQVKISNSSPAWNEDVLMFKADFDGAIIPFQIKETESRIKEITSVNILKNKREYRENFTWVGENKLCQRTNEFYVKEKLKSKLSLEKQIIENSIMFGYETLGQIDKIDIKVSNELIIAYEKIINYYKIKNNIPSLVFVDEELRDLYLEYLIIYNKEIQEIEENTNLINNEKKKNLLRVGVIEAEGKQMFTPLAPINVAYMLELEKELSNEDIESHILERLTAENLVPYIYGNEGHVYKQLHQKDNLQWTIFEQKERVTIGQSNIFIAKVVREKIEQFKNNFNYIFLEGANAPIKINVININNDKEVVKGIFDYVRNQIRKNSNKIVPIEVSVYNQNGYSAFDTFFELTEIEKLEEEFNISFDAKNTQVDENDVLRLVLENLKYFKKNSEKYEYAHISFYKSIDNDEVTQKNMEQIESGLSLSGILSSVTSNNDGNDYRIGFGTKNIIDINNKLVETAINTNELAFNLEKNGANDYRRGMSITTRPTILADQTKRDLFEASNWVTFIEPGFGLEYFKKDSDDNLVVVHYSDQYSSTDQYDTITVTNKSNQYRFIIREFLAQKNITDISNEKIDSVIASFNSINGEWLLNLIANKGEYDREKLSIISAVKYGLAMLNNEDIIWIPISLEEILRVSGAVKLNKSEGIFSVKNLKQKGVHSDDLIFIGVNIADESNIKVFYYPVEVKIGHNFEGVIDKGKIQVQKTYNLLKSQLVGEEETSFKHKFFRNFFMKLLIANAKKFDLNGIWREKDITKIEKLKKYLLNDKYEISFDLENRIGKGALISFKKDNHWRSAKIDEEIMFIELTENDAYRGIEKSVNEIYNEFLQGQSDISLEKLLYNVNLNEVDPKCVISEGDDKGKTRVLVPTGEEEVEVSGGDTLKNKGLDTESEVEIDIRTVEKNKTLADTRILLGEAEGSTRNIYWEYGNKELANRHMLITGKSGNGKTYFIQCALKELVDAGVPAIIIDYTDGFKSSQLEPEFKEAMGDRLKQFIVAANKFPLNIFKKGMKELDEGLEIPEDDIDVAERFKSVIGAVYRDLGIQQLNSIYENVISGLEKYDGKLNLRAFRDELEEDKSNYAQTALSQLKVLIDKNPFEESSEFDWEELHADGGKLFIIQLTGYTKEVQKIITEMILWNLYMYKAQNGSKDKPFAVVLDEAQNLNFGDNAPSTKILTEGRKFGWSAWFSTQFLKGQMDKATISRLQNSAQKIYFAQTEEEASIVANAFGETTEEKKAWTRRLINLEKGNCISHGPIRNEIGELIPSKPTKVKITPLYKR